MRAFIGGSGSSVALQSNARDLSALLAISNVQSSAATAISEASKAGFDTGSVAQQINYGFAGDVGVSPPMEHRIDGTGISVPEDFGDQDDTLKKKKKK